MSQPNRISGGLKGQFHPVSHYDSPGDVLQDGALSAAEKRMILSSWASDMYAVESNPALREIPGIAQPMRLSDILAALRALDGDIDPRPRGGAAIRVWRPTSLNAVARTWTADKPRRAVRRSWVAAPSPR